jgi:hypothetical protein
MIFKILLLLFFSFSLYGSEIVWSSSSVADVSDGELNEALRKYYPEELMAWEKQKREKQKREKQKREKHEREREREREREKREREINEKSVRIGKLMWQDDEAAASVEKDWNGAIAYCEKLKLLGFDDWRLPTKDELVGIVDKSRSRPAIRKEFKNVSSGDYPFYYWSSTTFEHYKGNAWVVYINDGGVYGVYVGAKGSNGYVRCVRAGQ